MPDIQLRFHRDMLVLSAPVDAMLAKQGIDASRDRQYLNLMEPDSIRDAFRLEMMAGAQCLVTTTEDITQARLAHLRMDGDAARLAHAAIAVANEVKPQHVLVEIGPSGLPIDASSKASLNESRAQYANAARFFEGEKFDAFFLNGFTSIPALKCALMGVAQVSDKPVFASVTIGGSQDEVANRVSEVKKEAPDADIDIDLPFGGYTVFDESANRSYVPGPNQSTLDPATWPAALDAMIDLGAAVVGFETADPIDKALTYVRTAVDRTNLPVLTQLRVSASSVRNSGKNLTPLEDIDEYTPDSMANVAVKLYGAGVQFLRATGDATSAYTGVLAATVMGLDVRQR